MSNFGWVPHENRTREGVRLHEDAVAKMPSFGVSYVAPYADDRVKVDLTDIWSHSKVVQVLGAPFPGVHQQTGSCVGAGGGNCLFTLAALEAIIHNEIEAIEVPFWLLTYARSRSRGGMRGRGEGSFGSTFAEAAKEDGFVECDCADVPLSNRHPDGWNWGKQNELDWSDGNAEHVTRLLSASRKHLVKSVAPCKSAGDVEQAIRNNYPVTTASSLIPNFVVESDGEAYGQVSRSGGHQTCFLGVWNHPVKGKKYFKYVNQWSRRWAKNGAVWIPEDNVDRMIQDGRETYAFSQFAGFPAQTVDWYV